jgi:hypothetical protein
MSESGVFLRESVLDIAQVENLFVTPRMFNFYMSRKSSEEWEAEQNKDKNNSTLINIQSIEKGVNTDPIEKLLLFESGKADYRKVSDTDLCIEIDRNILPKYRKKSIYQLSLEEKIYIANHIHNALHLNVAQIHRCLALQ